jgi:hypothetical protein
LKVYRKTRGSIKNFTYLCYMIRITFNFLIAEGDGYKVNTIVKEKEFYVPQLGEEVIIHVPGERSKYYAGIVKKVFWSYGNETEVSITL